MPENQKVDDQSCDEQEYSRELVPTRELAGLLLTKLV